jgi:hypothetical protein
VAIRARLQFLDAYYNMLICYRWRAKISRYAPRLPRSACPVQGGMLGPAPPVWTLRSRKGVNSVKSAHLNSMLASDEDAEHTIGRVVGEKCSPNRHTFWIDLCYSKPTSAQDCLAFRSANRVETGDV